MTPDESFFAGAFCMAFLALAVWAASELIDIFTGEEDGNA